MAMGYRWSWGTALCTLIKPLLRRRMFTAIMKVENIAVNVCALT